MSQLPQGWTLTTFGELGRWCGGGTPSKTNPAFWTGGDIPWISPKDMKHAQISDAEDRITEAAVEGSSTQKVPPDSVLFVTRSGILRHTLPVAVNLRTVTINQDLKALTPASGIRAAFVAEQARSKADEIFAVCSKSGTTVDSIDFESLKSFPFTLPPLPEQRRIVAKIDSLSEKSKRARDRLDHLPPLVERYKGAIVAAAFSGRLSKHEGFRESQRSSRPLIELIQEGPSNGWSPKSGPDVAQQRIPK